VGEVADSLGLVVDAALAAEHRVSRTERLGDIEPVGVVADRDTLEVPSRLAARTPQSPTAPSPTTTQVLPTSTPALTAAWRPVPSTSVRGSAARSVSSSSS